MIAPHLGIESVARENGKIVIVRGGKRHVMTPDDAREWEREAIDVSIAILEAYTAGDGPSS